MWPHWAIRQNTSVDSLSFSVKKLKISTLEQRRGRWKRWDMAPEVKPLVYSRLQERPGTMTGKILAGRGLCSVLVTSRGGNELAPLCRSLIQGGERKGP